MWLVLMACSMDDFPVRLFTTPEAADNFIRENNTEDAISQLELRSEVLFKMTPTEFLCWKVVQFDGCHPVAVQVTEFGED